MEFDKINFKLTDNLKSGFKFPKYGWVERSKRVTPEPLYVLCARICDYLPEEPCFKWTNMHVLMWIEAIGFPQYRNTFYVNMINGRTLLLLDASALCRMNIKDFDHILIIAKSIRDLYKVEKVLFSRSISLPPRYPDTHFKLFRVCSGPTYQRTTRAQLWTRMKIIQEFPPHRDHWTSLHNYLQHKPQHQMVRIGYAPRLNLYAVKRAKQNDLPSVSSLILLEEDVCHCIPPCECKWIEDHYKQSWTLSVLQDLETNDLNSQIEDGDLIVASAEAVNAESGENIKSFENPCDCIVPHICHWNTKTYAKEPYVLSVVRLYRSYAESSGNDIAFDCCCEATRN